MIIIKKNLRIMSQVLKIPKFKLLIKSADTFAFKKKLLALQDLELQFQLDYF